LEQIQVQKGENLLKEGDISNNFYYINKGLFRTYIQVHEKEANTEFFLENSFAGAFTSYLTGMKTKLNIQSLEDSIVTVFPKDYIINLCEHSPSWLGLEKHIFENEFMKKCKRESDLLLINTKERYLNFLHEYPYIEERVQGYHIASFLGVKAESLSRIRSSKI
jgi:CRP-like cAMP-binding protein